MKDEYKDYITLKPYQFLSTRVIYEGLWKDQKKKTELANNIGRMDQSITANGRIIKLTGKAG